MDEAIVGLAASLRKGGVGRLAKRNAIKIALDTSLVVSGLRPACLLDYCGLDLPAHQLDPLLRSVSSAAADDCQCYEIQDDGSVLVVNLRRLREWHGEMRRESSCAIVQTTSRPSVVSGPERQELHDNFGQVLSDLEQRRKLDHQHRGSASQVASIQVPLSISPLPPATCWTRASPSTSTSSPSAPTILGFLLGFPVIYHCASDSLDAAVTALRNCSLTVLSCSGVLSAAMRVEVRGAERAHVISQFSFPSNWARSRDGESVAEAVRLWQERTASDVQSHSDLSRIFTEVEHEQRRVPAGNGVTL